MDAVQCANNWAQFQCVKMSISMEYRVSLSVLSIKNDQKRNIPLCERYESSVKPNQTAQTPDPDIIAELFCTLLSKNETKK